MTYTEATDWLFTLNRFGMKLGLDNIRALCDALGRPQDRFDSVLIAGTNGKGSTAAMLHAILRSAGIRAGLYTSPHLVRAEERIRIDDADIETRDLVAILGQLRTTIDSMLARGVLGAHPTFFEVATAAAFVAFARSGVRVAVLEVGLGGRLDATNVVDPVLSIITSIDFDHMEQLGNTLAAIAREKAGILRAGGTTLVGDLAREPRAAIRKEARALGATIVMAHEGSSIDGPHATGPAFAPELAMRTPVREYPHLSCPLLGAHQAHNALLAVRAAELLDGPGRPIGPEAIVEGIRRTRWPGRLEWIEGRPALLLDGAHNPAGARALDAYLRGLGRSPVLLFGAMRDKDAGPMLEVLLPRARACVFTKPAMERAAEPAALLEAARALALPVPAADDYHVDPDPAAALERARGIAGPGGLVLATGSLFLVGAVKAMLEGAPVRPGEFR